MILFFNVLVPSILCSRSPQAIRNSDSCRPDHCYILSPLVLGTPPPANPLALGTLSLSFHLAPYTSAKLGGEVLARLGCGLAGVEATCAPFAAPASRALSFHLKQSIPGTGLKDGRVETSLQSQSAPRAGSWEEGGLVPAGCRVEIIAAI